MWLLLSEDGIQMKICRKKSYFMRVEDMDLAVACVYMCLYECVHPLDCACACLCVCVCERTSVCIVCRYTCSDTFVMKLVTILLVEVFVFKDGLYSK